jgi:hypothetical protein
MRGAPSELPTLQLASSLGSSLEVAKWLLWQKFSRAFPKSQIDVEILKTIAMFCGVGLVVALLLATNGLDMSAGFF